MSAALLDGLVALAALWAMSRARGFAWANVAWCGGMALVALAASVGAVRYALAPGWAVWHERASSLATFVGMPAALLGLALQPGFRVSARAKHAAPWAAAGVALAVFAAVVVGDEGTWNGVPREQYFHLVFAAALGCLGRAYAGVSATSRVNRGPSR